MSKKYVIKNLKRQYWKSGIFVTHQDDATQYPSIESLPYRIKGSVLYITGGFASYCSYPEGRLIYSVERLKSVPDEDLGRLCNILGLRGGTLYQVEAELLRLKNVEKKTTALLHAFFGI